MTWHVFYCCIVEDGAVIWWDFRPVGEKEIATGTTVGLWLTEIAGIAMCCENHVATIVGEYYIFLHGKVVEDLVCVSKSVLCYFGHLGSYGTDWSEDRAINCSSGEEEFATNFLDELLSIIGD